MISKYLGEFIGTFLFAMAGFAGSKFIPNIKNSVVVTALISGAALVIGVIIALKLGGEGALNPGFTIAEVVKGSFSSSVAAGYIVSQVLGVVAAYFVFNALSSYNWCKVPDAMASATQAAVSDTSL